MRRSGAESGNAAPPVSSQTVPYWCRSLTIRWERRGRGAVRIIIISPGQISTGCLGIFFSECPAKGIGQSERGSVRVHTNARSAVDPPQRDGLVASHAGPLFAFVRQPQQPQHTTLLPARPAAAPDHGHGRWAMDVNRCCCHNSPTKSALCHRAAEGCGGLSSLKRR